MEEVKAFSGSLIHSLGMKKKYGTSFLSSAIDYMGFIGSKILHGWLIPGGAYTGNRFRYLTVKDKYLFLCFAKMILL